MRRRLMAIALACTVASALSGQSQASRGGRAQSDVALRLHIPAGFVEVVGWDMDSVDVVATPAPGSRFDGGGTASAMKFAVESRRDNDTSLAAARIRLRVPRNARVWLKSTTAALSVHGVHGEVEFITVSGEAQVGSGAGVVSIESIDGPVTIDRTEGTFRVRGGSGRVLLQSVVGTVDISTIGGEVAVSRIVVDDGTSAAHPSLSGRIETVNGSVRLGGVPGPKGRLEVSTHGGDITLVSMGARAPRLVTTITRGSVDAAFRAPNATLGEIVVRSFRGALNATHQRGI